LHREIELLLTCTAICGVSFSASAADLPLKSRPVPVEVYTWSGFYVGGHVGGAWLNDTDATATSQLSGAPPTTQTGTFANSDHGFLFGGAQAGYNWQFGNFVAGVEADISISGLKQNQTLTLTDGAITDVVTSTRAMDWFGTVRGRIGYLFVPRLLGYLTGGFAYGRTHNDVNQLIAAPFSGGPFVLNSFGRRATGWTAGAGIEYMITRQWSLKGEYQYIDLNDGSATTNTIEFFGGKAHGVFTTQSSDTKAHTVQVGLNYHFWAP
jgi:outer membrane immunogenic protein